MVRQRQYQLTGCVSLIVAAKFRETSSNVPSSLELCKMCDSIFTVKDLARQEWKLLSALGWTVGHPDACTFIQTRLAGRAQPPRLEHMSVYIAEITLFFRDFINARPSVLSASAQALAQYVMNHLSRCATPLGDYDPEIFRRLYSRVQMPPQILFNKYASEDYSQVSWTVSLVVHPPSDGCLRMAAMS